MYLTEPFGFRYSIRYIWDTSYIIIIKSNGYTFPIIGICFCGCVPAVLCHHILSVALHLSRKKLSFLSTVNVKSVMCTNEMIHCTSLLLTHSISSSLCRLCESIVHIKSLSGISCRKYDECDSHHQHNNIVYR